MWKDTSGAGQSTRIESILDKAGYASYRLYQKNLLRALSNEKDVLIECIETEDITFSLLLPVYAKIRESDTSLKALIITNSHEVLKYLEEAYAKLSSGRGSAFLAVLDPNEVSRNDLKLLAKKPRIIAGTAERIIDHIRRGNTDLSEANIVSLHEPKIEDRPGFIKDISYIFSKLPKRPRLILVTESIGTMAEELQKLARRPQIFSKVQWLKERAEHYYADTPKGKTVSDTIADIVESERLHHVLIVCETPDEAAAVHELCSKKGLKTLLAVDPDRRKISEFDKELFKNGTIKIIIRCRSYNWRDTIPGIQNIVISGGQKLELEYCNDLDFFDTTADPLKVFICIKPGDNAKVKTLQEMTNVELKKVEPQTKDSLENTIKEIVTKIREEANPEELEQYRKIFKKHVPIFLRSYFAAYLLKQTQVPKGGTKGGNYISLFVGIGKNRKVYPRDIARLFTGTGNIKPEDIGEIKILDNYSFVDIAESQAQKAIDLVNGTSLRGRKIAVNFARKKESSPENKP